MGIRVERVTTCPGCRIKVTVCNSRPNAKKRKYCNSCKKDPDYSKFTSAVSRIPSLTLAKYKELSKVTHCECCNVALIDGGGPGVGARDKRQIDHCHDTGRVRGVLCWDCNSAIGKLGDNKEGIQRALQYLTRKS